MAASLISTVHDMLSVVLRGENTHFIVSFRNFGTRCFFITPFQDVSTV